MVFEGYIDQVDKELKYEFKNDNIISKYLESNTNIKFNDIYSNLELERDIKIIDKTQTKFGSLYFKKRIMAPTNDISKLLYNKNNIVKFSNNEVYNNMRSSLEKIEKIQTSLIQFYDESFIKNNNNIDSVYFNDFFEKFNQSDRCLHYYSMFNIYYPAYSIFSPIILIIIPILIHKLLPHIDFNESVFLKTFSVGIPTFETFKVDDFKGFASSALTLIFFVYNVYISLKFSYHTDYMNKYIKEHLVNIKEIIDISNEIYNLNNIGEHLQFKKFDTKFISKFDKIDYNGYNMVLFKELINNKDDLLSYIKFISQIDYYVSINTLIKNNGYRMVMYNNMTKPKLNIENFKHPYLNNGIENSIKIGNGEESQNIIITGPNASGKSTILKSVLFNIILAQTISVSLCSSMEITPFKNIYSYLTKDDKLGKMSLFEKEITNLTDYLELLENNELSLLLVDEIMSGTNFNESTKISYAICKNLNKFKNNISLITTHNNKITKLEKNNRSVNYKMVIDKNDTNIYTYKLVKGISNDFLGMDILKSKMNI
jgi:DNA mismatch repair ATPase MutS